MNGGFWTWMAQLNARRIFMVLLAGWVLLGAWMVHRDQAKLPVAAPPPPAAVSVPVGDKAAPGRGGHRPRLRREPISNLFTSP
ncbi:MAG: hypothetical protein K9N49_09050, partial [Candidatus Marinimicrobia bacterium]|nr:hypothetical protein [Candidatus Neomarinimicrobiota bacterium]